MDRCVHASSDCDRKKEFSHIDFSVGARSGEILAIEYRRIDRNERVIPFARRTQNGESEIAPLTQEKLDAIDLAPRLPSLMSLRVYNPATRDWYEAQQTWGKSKKGSWTSIAQGSAAVVQ